MAFCEQCGTQLGANAAFCSGCGTAVTASVAVPLAVQPGTLVAAGIAAAAVPQDESAGLSEKWRRRFAAIEQARVGDAASSLSWRFSIWSVQRRTGLTFVQSWGLNWRLIWNFWAWTFGPFYYLYLGMWRKAITLTVLVVLIDVVIGMAGDALNISDALVAAGSQAVWMVLFQHQANISYYRKIILGRNGWW